MFKSQNSLNKNFKDRIVNPHFRFLRLTGTGISHSFVFFVHNINCTEEQLLDPNLYPGLLKTSVSLFITLL